MPNYKIWLITTNSLSIILFGEFLYLFVKIGKQNINRHKLKLICHYSCETKWQDIPHRCQGCNCWYN